MATTVSGLFNSVLADAPCSIGSGSSWSYSPDDGHVWFWRIHFKCYKNVCSTAVNIPFLESDKFLSLVTMIRQLLMLYHSDAKNGANKKLIRSRVRVKVTWRHQQCKLGMIGHYRQLQHLSLYYQPIQCHQKWKFLRNAKRFSKSCVLVKVKMTVCLCSINYARCIIVVCVKKNNNK